MPNQDLFQDRSKSSQKILAVLILVVCVALLVTFAAISWIVRKSDHKLGSDNCPENGMAAEYLAVVIDASEPYEPIQQEAIKKDFRELLDSVPLLGRVALYVVDDQTTEGIEPDLAICNPGSGKGANPWFQNPVRLKSRWQKEFDDPLNSSIERILPAADARSSPIMEAIQIIAVKEFPRNANAPKRIVLFSDLLQHTDSYSMYREPDTKFEDFKSRPEFGKLRSILSEVSVRVFYVRRDGAARTIQGRSHIRFWEEYFQAMGAQIIEVSWIEG